MTRLLPTKHITAMKKALMAAFEKELTAEFITLKDEPHWKQLKVTATDKVIWSAMKGRGGWLVRHDEKLFT